MWRYAGLGGEGATAAKVASCVPGGADAPTEPRNPATGRARHQTPRLSSGARCAPASSTSASAPSTARTWRTTSTTCSPTTRIWGIIGASLRRPDTKQALDPQGGLYTLALRSDKGTRARILGSVLEVIDATTDLEELLEQMAHEDIRIVSLTVTEKGYCHDPSTGELDEKQPDIVHDLENPMEPRSAPGIIVEALARRFQRDLDPFAVMSCDNLPSNGETTRKIVVRFAKLRDPELGSRIEEAVVFPSTMVDRIVPATTDADRAEVAKLTGLDDAWPVVTEPFAQFVIENRFPGGRPQFEAAGAEMVARRRALRADEAPDAQRQPFEPCLSRLSRGLRVRRAGHRRSRRSRRSSTT